MAHFTPDPQGSSQPADAEIDHLREEVHDLKVEAEHARQEVDQIAEIHQTLLPTSMPTIRGMDVAASHVAPNKAGGDYFDFLPLRRGEDLSPSAQDKWLVIVADASGHGPAAAMIMAMLQAVLHAYSADCEDPGVVLEFINQQMARKNVEGSFTTAILAILDPAAAMFSFASAGHHPPLVRTAEGAITELPCEAGGPPLAVDAQARIGSHTHPLAEGDTVLLYTDGAIEQVDPAGEQLGVERLKKVFAQAPGRPRRVLSQINEAFRRHRGSTEQDDDKTLVAIHRRSSEEGG